jgi:glycosyltransferase involved in cell wall biosynthesis
LLFTFIKYLNPGWQYNLLPYSKTFSSCCILNNGDVAIDKRYATLSAQLADAGFMLWNKGVLLQSSQSDIEYLESLNKPTLNDEYIFIRKYGGVVWTTYALVLRLLALKNPFNEVRNYFNTRNIRKVKLYKESITYKDYESFQSEIVRKEPLVAVIIPTLNRYTYLKDVLDDLEKQTYKNIEVIIVDQSDDFNTSFYENYQLNIRLVRQKEQKLWTARNKAITATNAEYLLFFDDDSRVQPSWVTEHLKCIDYFDADISAGVSISVVGGKVPENYGYFRWADQFDSGNALVKRAVFEKIGLFDEQFNCMRMGDGEFGIRAYLHGLKSISNHKAQRIHLKADSGGLRDISGWDSFRPKKMFEPKPIPSVTFLYYKYFSATLAQHAILKGMLLSNVSYKYKGSSKMLTLSLLLSAIKAPLLYIQFRCSKKVAKCMIQKNGIKMLNTGRLRQECNT